MQKKKPQPKRKKNNIGSVRETDRERNVIELACGRWSVYERLAWVSAHPQITIPGARSYGISHTLPHTKLSISGKTNLWRYQCFL